MDEEEAKIFLDLLYAIRAKNVSWISSFIQEEPRSEHYFKLKSDKDKNTLLHYAAATSNPLTVKQIIRGGCPTDEKNDEGETPLLLAAGHKQTEIALSLINEKANVNASNNNGVTVMHLSLIHI